MPSSAIAIVGYASRLPQTDDARFWDDLLAGRTLVTRVAADRWAQPPFLHPDRAHPGTSVTFAAGSLGDISGFDAGFFRISPREAAAMDPQQRLLLEMSWEALAQAGIRPGDLRGSRTGVFVGLSSTDYAYRLADDPAALGPHSATGGTASIAANRISYVFDLQGPSLITDTACSSGLVAFHQACQALRTGECGLALAGAISLHLHPYGFLVFSQASMLSATGRSRPFQAGADGYVRAEGGGVFVLKRLDQARRDGDPVLAVVAGTGINADGAKNGLTVPRAETQAALLRHVYTGAGLDPQDLDYLEAHGTGTAVGDPVELEAVGQALARYRPARHPLPVGSVKGNVGHLETASAVPALIKAIHCLRTRCVPPTAGLDTLNPDLPLDRYPLEIVRETRPLRPAGPLHIGINSFGFGGANAHALLQGPPRWRRPRAPHSAPPGQDAGKDPGIPAGARPFLLTAADQPALRQSATGLAAAIAAQPAVAWERFAREGSFRREWLAERALFWVHDRADLLENLRAYGAGQGTALEGRAPRSWPDRPEPGDGQTVFVYSGNGCQWTGMGQALLGDPVFSATVDAIDGTFAPLAGYRLRDEFSRPGPGDRYASTAYAQPALFALQAGMTAWFRDQGIVPAAVLGHSVGEVAAAWASGALSLADATRVIHARSQIQERTRGLGQMTAVALGADSLLDRLARWDLAPHLHIAAWNSPRGCTTVGSPAVLSALEQRLRDEGTAFRRLALDYPFHGPEMDGLEIPLREALQGISPREGTIPFLSAVTGEARSGAALDAGYWWRNIREPVRFEAAVRAARPLGALFLELGGHPVLRNYLQDILADPGQTALAIPTLRRGQTDGLSGLWLAGAPAHWSRYYPAVSPPVPLPAYPWQRERHWHTVTTESAGLLYREAVHPLLGHPVPGHPGEWEQRLDTATLPWLADHQVGDQILLAGAAFAETVLAAGQQPFLPDRVPLRITDLEIPAPLVLEPGTGRILRTRVQEDRVFLESRPEFGGHWTLHIRARVEKGPAAPPPALFAPLEFRAEGTDPDGPAAADAFFDARTHQTRTGAAGLHYGPAFRTVVQGVRQGSRLQAALAPTLSATETAPLFLDPTLMDGAFQLFVDLLPETPPETPHAAPFVPVRVDRLDWWPEGGAPVDARLALVRRSPHSLLADLELRDAGGRLRARIQGLRLQRWRLPAGRTATPREFRTVLRPQPRAEAPGALDWAALGTGLAERLAEHPDVQRYQEEFVPLLGAYLDPAGAGQAEALWHTLLQDYPAHQHWTLAAGRKWLERTGQSPEAAVDADGDGLARQDLPVLAGSLAGILAERLAVAARAGGDSAPLQVAEIDGHLPELLPRLYALDLPGTGLWSVRPPGAEADGGDSPWRQTGFDAPAGVLPPLDFAWAHLDLAAGNRLSALLDWAWKALRPGGILLLCGIPPAPWWPLLGADGASADPWHIRATAENAGFSVPDFPLGAGFWLLPLEKPRTGAAAPVPAGDRYLLLAPTATRDALAAGLAGTGVTLQTSGWPPEDGLAGWPARTPGPWTAVLCAPALDTAPVHPVPALASLLPAIRDLAQECLAAPGSPRLDLVLPGALDPREASGLLAAAVAAFVRSLQNEWPDLRLRVLDVDPTLPGVQDALRTEILFPDGEREIRLAPDRPRLVPRTELAPAPQAEAEAYVLRNPQPGQLRHLVWEPLDGSPDLPPDQVEVGTVAAGLNFRDVMYTLGLLGDEALENGFSGPALGLEFSGRVLRAGSAVTDWRPGDAVLGFAPASFAGRVRTPAGALAPLPVGMDFIQAATVPVAFFTAWYALRTLAGLQPGERVLLHGAAGGVGIAAVQIARLAGAEIFATAGSAPRRDFLRLLGVRHLYDSRRLDFADAIRADTGGEGVDVVLNSLAGDAMRLGLDLLRPFGRFLELGKRDFYAGTALGLRPMRNNLRYFGIDADQMLAYQPRETRQIFAECLDAFRRGDLWPLPATRFPAHGAREAFRSLQQSRQIGKTVLETRPPFLPMAREAPAQTRLAPDPEGVYWITGGTSGFGAQCALRLLARGARRLLLASRSGIPGEAEAAAFAHWVRQGADIRLRSADVTSLEALEALRKECDGWGPLRGIVHAAAHIEDALAGQLDPGRMHRVLAPKICGAENLHRLTVDRPLDFFVVCSSIANLLGNPGQAHYLAANAWMEALVHQRRLSGLCGTALQFGPIADAGFLARSPDTRRLLERRLGGRPLSSAQALDALEAAITSGTERVAVADLHWNQVRTSLVLASSPQYAALDASGPSSTERGARAMDARESLRDLDGAAALTFLEGLIVQETAQILRLPPERIDPHRKLGDLGFDSLMGMELALALEERLDLKIPATLTGEEPDVHHLARRLWRTLQADRDSAESGSRAPADMPGLLLARQHGVASEYAAALRQET